MKENMLAEKDGVQHRKNQEDKSRFFALYIFKDVFRMKGNASTMTLDPVHLIKPSVELNTGWLQLKPLSAISDEDKQEVGKILQVFPEDVLDWINGEISHDDFNNPFTFQHAIDYLRSKGYAIPFIGKSVEELVELGWVVLKEREVGDENN